MEILGIIQGAFTFWKQLVWFIKLLQGTPLEQHDKLITAIQKEVDDFKQTGRPSW